MKDVKRLLLPVLVLVLLSGSFECWAQAVHVRVMPPCCNQEPCRSHQGIPSNSACEMQSQNGPVAAQVPAFAAAPSLAPAAGDEIVAGIPVTEDPVAAPEPPFEPPDLFLQSSSFRI